MKGTMLNLINLFSEKNSHLGKWAILGPKMVHPHNSGSAVRIFLKSCTMKESNSKMKMILIIFSQKKFVWGKGTIFGPKWCILITQDLPQEFFLNFVQ